MLTIVFHEEIAAQLAGQTAMSILRIVVQLLLFRRKHSAIFELNGQLDEVECIPAHLVHGGFLGPAMLLGSAR